MRWTSLIARHACFFVSSTPFMLLMSGSEVFLFNISFSRVTTDGGKIVAMLLQRKQDIHYDGNGI
jgi:hypothetical protein